MSLSLPVATIPPSWAVSLGLALFAVGLVGVTCRRNILIMLLSVEILLNAANLVLVGFSRVHHDLGGQVFVFFSMTVAAAEVAVGLAIVIAVYRLRRSADVNDAQDLHEIETGPVARILMEGDGHASQGHASQGHASLGASHGAAHAPSDAHAPGPAAAAEALVAPEAHR